MDTCNEFDMKEIDEAFKMENQQQADRFSSYDKDEDDCNISEDDESFDSFGSDEESDLEEVDDKVKESVTQDDEFGNVLNETCNFEALKSAFEALCGRTTSDCKSDNDSKQQSTIDRSPGAISVLPLYAMLPASTQLRVFEEIKEGARLVVVATNVAETSLTIPGIKYVVDTGREKAKNYNSSNRMETYEVQWISKASAAQRAGRTGPGHCYRLYSYAVFNNIFADFSTAEILKTPVDGVLLLMKSHDRI
ncbi:hypothetical protein R6Q59_014557 [Mikania micrantha]